jgi:hypothetical protein
VARRSGQFWLQPAFGRAFRFWTLNKSRMKGGCSQNWPPYKTTRMLFPGSLIAVAFRLDATRQSASPSVGVELDALLLEGVNGGTLHLARWMLITLQVLGVLRGVKRML